jgi:ATP-dependent Clp protease adaptor protein ClpS
MTDPLHQDESESGTGLKEEVREPRKYKVLLHNDDYTTMEFVVQVLMTVFHKTETEATQVMLAVHKNGLGVCGVYTAEVAETKVVAVRHMARQGGYPLKCTMEEE